MKKIRIINNPSSGRNTIQKKLDEIIKILLNRGYTVSKYSTSRKLDAEVETIKTIKNGWDMILVCGGDGTVSEVVSGIAQSENKIPVVILAAGTVNDFANYLKIPTDSEKFCDMIENEKILSVDIGTINDRYFINVASGGILTEIAHTVAPDVKSVLGKTAYYLEGIREVPKQVKNSMKIKFKTKEKEIIEDVSLFLITNSSSIGGFKNLAPEARVSDGKLDCIIIKKAEVYELVSLFVEVLSGNHLNNPGVIYFKTDDMEIISLDDEEVEIDTDGEYGGKLPVKIGVLPRMLKLIVP